MNNPILVGHWFTTAMSFMPKAMLGNSAATMKSLTHSIIGMRVELPFKLLLSPQKSTLIFQIEVKRYKMPSTSRWSADSLAHRHSIQ